MAAYIVVIGPVLPSSIERVLRMYLVLGCDDAVVVGPVRLCYNPYFSACFFSRNSIFLSQQISQNSVSACFFSEAKEAKSRGLEEKYIYTVLGHISCSFGRSRACREVLFA